MTDDLLGTVKAALAEADGACYVSWRHVHQLAELRHWLRALVDRCEQAEAEVKSWQDDEASQRHCCWLNEERANKAETDLAALRQRHDRLREALEAVCRDLTVIEYTCDHVNYDHATATALTNLYLKAKAALEGDHD